MPRKTLWICLVVAVAPLLMVSWIRVSDAKSRADLMATSPPVPDDEGQGGTTSIRPSGAPQGVDADSIAREQRDRLANAIQSQLNGNESSAQVLVMQEWLPQLAALDPLLACQLMETNGLAIDRADWLRVIANAWAVKDSGSALVWAAQLATPAEQRLALATIIFQLAQTDPEHAVAVAIQYHLNGEADGLLSTLGVQWSEKNLSAALAWAQRQPPGDQRDQILARMAFVEARNAPADAGTRVLAEIPPGDVQNEAVMTVIHQWSLRDMAGALAWVRQFPETPLKERAMNELRVIYRQTLPTFSAATPVAD